MLINVTPVRCDPPHLMHLTGGRECASCIAHWMLGRSLAQVTAGALETGLISTDALEGYRNVWASSVVRSATYDHWLQLPESSVGRVYAQLLREILLTSGVDK